jgi:hypothetical protein
LKLLQLAIGLSQGLQQPSHEQTKDRQHVLQPFREKLYDKIHHDLDRYPEEDYRQLASRIIRLFPLMQGLRYNWKFGVITTKQIYMHR